MGDASPRFDADLRSSLTASGTAVALDLELPYSELQFIRLPGGYGAVLQVTVVFRSAKKNEQVGGDVWEDRIVVPTFEASRDPASRARFRRTFSLPAGEYRVELSVEDQNGGRRSLARGVFEVPAFSAGGLGLGRHRVRLLRAPTASSSRCPAGATRRTSPGCACAARSTTAVP